MSYANNNLLSPKRISAPMLFDRWLLFSVFGLIAIGLLLVASTSIVISERQYGTPFHYIIRQAIFLGIGVIVAALIMKVETATWQRFGPILLIFSLGLLVLVLIPGVGRSVNGSSRWIRFGFFGLQVSEVVKFSVIIYLSGYLVRHQQEVINDWRGFLKPLVIIGIIAILLLLQPDFGATVVVMTTVLAMLFLAGVRLWQFAALFAVVCLGLGVLAVSSPYRLLRLTSFLNPWANQFDSGYQLTQSLIAFGRGGIFGVGLGESVQKLFYLPEAHTDFLFAVLAEELGLIGELVVIGLFSLFVARTLLIARKAWHLERYFNAYMAYGIAFWVGLQAVINIGVNSGLLPTKGLTLPFMSYGGSSMLVMCVVVALLLRIDYETRFEMLGLGPRF